MADIISETQTKQLQGLRDLLGEARFQRIQREVWKRFSSKAPPINREGNLAPLALIGIWEELIDALREAATRRPPKKESAGATKPASGLLWELVKSGVKWSATLNLRSDQPTWEVVITRNGQRSNVQRFVNRERAEKWADKECLEIALGWKQ